MSKLFVFITLFSTFLLFVSSFKVRGEAAEIRINTDFIEKTPVDVQTAGVEISIGVSSPSLKV